MALAKYLIPGGGLILLMVAGCAGTAPVTKTAENYFNEAEEFYQSHKYEDAIAQWKKVKETYASLELTTKAELKIADAHFDNHSYIEAAAAYEDFRKLHPNHSQAPYALYRLGLCYYNEITGIDTDQAPVKNAVATFQTFLKNYPASEYAAEVRETLNLCVQKQVQYEIYVGRFYLRTGKYAAATKRLEECLLRYPKADVNDETLFYLGKAYFLAGDKNKGKEVFNRLAKQYLSSKYLEEAKEVMEKYY